MNLQTSFFQALKFFYDTNKKVIKKSYKDLTKKYLEQWWIWIVVDAELSALYVYKDIPFTAGLYALYVSIAIAGYRRWKKEMNSQTLCKENQNNA